MTTTTRLQRQVRGHFLAASLVLLFLCGALLMPLDGQPISLPGISIVLIWPELWCLILTLAWRGLPAHPHQHFGPANIVTLYRAGGTVFIAGLIPIATELQLQFPWLMTLLVFLLLALDGLDGYLARRSGLSSDYGARFDMEIDALLILMVSLFLWQSGESGIWIISLGLMRYLFVAASHWCKPLQATLYPSFRRKLVCVIQLVALCAILSPLLAPPLSGLVGLLALICLSASFWRDILWLYRDQSEEARPAAQSAPGTVASSEIKP